MTPAHTDFLKTEIMLDSNLFLSMSLLCIDMIFYPIFSGVDPAECEGEETTTTTTTAATTTTTTDIGDLLITDRREIRKYYLPT